MNNNRILSLALSTPLRKTFHYLTTSQIPLWARVSAPFGHQKKLMGIITEQLESSDPPSFKLRSINKALDHEPVFDKEIFELCQWCADYYQYPLGEVCHLALPSVLRKPEPMPEMSESIWRITDTGNRVDLNSINKAKKQREALQLLLNEGPLPNEVAKQKIGGNTLKALKEKNWIEKFEQSINYQPLSPPDTLLKQEELALNSEQKFALDAVNIHQYSTCLIEGVTGSGKTEVYLQTIAKVLKMNRQALVLVPEIGLTPQTVSRFEARFNVPIAVLHSSLNNKERFSIWQQARHGQFSIIIGTRSSIFTQLPDLGLIIVDEEHDLSYKQQDGVRYSARDLAIVRAKKLNIPLILGTATPALESLHNALSGRYQHFKLTQRAQSQPLPTIECIEHPDNQLNQNTIEAIRKALDEQQQVLIFINRRGYAPALVCQSCGWISQCHRCDNRMTLHRSPKPILHCHSCDARSQVPKQCPCCNGQLQALGSGTQRSEEQLSALFPNTPTLRIDRDNVSRKGELQAALDTINLGEPCLLVGTQMLAKGHHFPNLGLAVILGLDSAFFSSDFRGAERMGQLLTQVAGRVGRENTPGRVMIQTRFTEHPLLQELINEGYSHFAQGLLAERRLTAMPPWQHLALFRCHGPNAQITQHFLQQLRQYAEQHFPPHNNLQYLGPFPASPEKRNNRYHSLLQIKTANRMERQRILPHLCDFLEKARKPSGLHWLIDIDPQEF